MGGWRYNDPVNWAQHSAFCITGVYEKLEILLFPHHSFSVFLYGIYLIRLIVVSVPLKFVVWLTAFLWPKSKGDGDKLSCNELYIGSKIGKI